jgi:hypothetical protein
MRQQKFNLYKNLVLTCRIFPKSINNLDVSSILLFSDRHLSGVFVLVICLKSVTTELGMYKVRSSLLSINKSPSNFLPTGLDIEFKTSDNFCFCSTS